MPSGQSSRGMLGRIRQRLISLARERHRIDIADTLDHPVAERTARAKAVAHAIETLRTAPLAVPRITDDVSLWLSSRSANALTVIGALFRWLIEQRYVLANPFSGIRVSGGGRRTPVDEGRVFSEGEWALVRAVANGLEWSYGWELAAAQRLRFVLDFAYATGLCSSELVGATLGQIETDAFGDHWLKRDATWSPWHTSRTLRLTRSQPRSLLSIPKLKSASSRTRLSIWRRTRSAQISLTLNGAFWPTILPLFHGSRRTVLTLDSMMDSHQVDGSPTMLRTEARCQKVLSGSSVR